jgi:hypothetical protein
MSSSASLHSSSSRSVVSAAATPRAECTRSGGGPCPLLPFDGDERRKSGLRTADAEAGRLEDDGEASEEAGLQDAGAAGGAAAAVAAVAADVADAEDVAVVGSAATAEWVASMTNRSLRRNRSISKHSSSMR